MVVFQTLWKKQVCPIRGLEIFCATIGEKTTRYFTFGTRFLSHTSSLIIKID